MMFPVSNDWQHPSKAIDATTLSKETGACDAISWAVSWVDPVDDIASAPNTLPPARMVVFLPSLEFGFVTITP